MERSKRVFKLKYKVAIHVLLVSLPCVLAVSAFSFMAAKHHVHEMIQFEYIGSLGRAKAHIRDGLADIEEDVRFLVSTPIFQGMGRARTNIGPDAVERKDPEQWTRQLERTLEEAVTIKSRYVRLAFADVSGKEVARIERKGETVRAVPEADLRQVTLPAIAAGALTEEAGGVGFHATDAPLQGKSGFPEKKPLIRCIAPVLDAEGTRMGIFLADVIPGSFLDMKRMLAVFQTKDTGRVFLADQNGLYLHRFDEQAGPIHKVAHTGARRRLGEDYPDLAGELLSGGEGSLSFGNRQIFYSTLRVSDRFSVVIGLDASREVVEAPVREFRVFLVYVIVSTLALTWIFSAWFTRRMLGSIHAIHAATKSIASGDLETSIDVRSNDEIEDLANSFNSMVTSLRDKTRRLTGIYDLGVHRARDPVEVADRVVSFIVLTTGSEMAMVERLGGDSRHVVSLCRNGRICHEGTFPVQGTSCEEVKRAAGVCSTRHAGVDLPDDVFLREQGVNTYVGVPVFSGNGQVAGAVALMDCRDTEPEEEDVELLQTLSRLVAFEWEREAHIGELKEASLDTIYRLSRAAEYRDEDTGLHLMRMSHYSAAIARRMGLNEKTREAILYAAPMHDVGKIGIPDRILLKPGKLDPEEWEIMKKHTTLGGRILEGSRVGFLKLAEVIALTHHEKWDGTGYPRGLEGSRIPLAGRITAVADVFDALTSARPYKAPFSLERALGIMNEGRGTHFDPRALDAFLSIMDEITAIMEKYKDVDSGALHKLAGSPT